MSDYSENYSHWNAVESLADWLKREHVPGITGIDTRELTKVLREHGVMMGRIVFDEMKNQAALRRRMAILHSEAKPTFFILHSPFFILHLITVR